jgi:hypothetical protein
MHRFKLLYSSGSNFLEINIINKIKWLNQKLQKRQLEGRKLDI